MTATTTETLSTGVREAPAWASLGEDVSEATSLEQALLISGMNDWHVRTGPVFTADPDNKTAKGLAARTVASTDRLRATMRSDPLTGKTVFLGIVGRKYRVAQNEDLFRFVSDLIAAGGEIQFHKAAVIDEGRRVFLSVKLGKDIMVGGEDAVDLYLVLYTSHDGSTGFRVLITPVRVECMNTIPFATRKALRTLMLRHTSSLEGRVEEARRQLDMTWKYADEFKAMAESLLSRPFSEADMRSYAEKLVPDPKSDAEGWKRRAQGARDAMVGVFLHDDTTEFGRGTAWAAYNAATYYADWVRPSKKRDALSLGVETDSFKENAYGLLVKA